MTFVPRAVTTDVSVAVLLYPGMLFVTVVAHAVTAPTGLHEAVWTMVEMAVTVETGRVTVVAWAVTYTVDGEA